MEDYGELLTRWTIRVALACYLIHVFLLLINSAAWQFGRVIWTVGFAVYLIHVLLAFHFYHNWSHAAAYQHTARQTASVVGIDWGGGIYFNHLLTIIWAIDVGLAWRETDPASKPRRRLAIFSRFTHLYFIYIIFNATVVFGPSFWFWIFTVGVVPFVLLTAYCRRRHLGSPS
jgi:hypothetical protein